LSTGDSQRIFRAVLDALARPGTLHRLPAAAGYPAALLPLLALADLSTPACVLADGGAWSGTVRALTSAPVTVLGEARLVAALRPVTDDELSEIRVGTAMAPEEGALVTLAVGGFPPNGPTCLLAGPGISGRRELRVAGLPVGFTRARRRLTQAFPAGADFLLVAPDGTMAGLPRTTLMEEESGEEEATPVPATAVPARPVLMKEVI
jgi:alpha-D-ribose 1-methylphosphonate 5-triphosphate synthase subunit PhnH